MRNLLKSWNWKYRRDDRRSGRPSKPRFRPWLEALEDRIEPSPAVAIAFVNQDALNGDISATDTAAIGCPRTLWLEALDASGNIANSYSGTVHFTSNDPLAQLPANYTFTAADQGLHTVHVTFGTIGSETVTATDGVLTDSYTTPTRTAGLLGFRVLVNNANVVQGTPVEVTVIATTDLSFGQVGRTPVDSPDTAYRGTIHFLYEDLYNNGAGAPVFLYPNPTVTLPADYTFTGADQGVHTFEIVPRASGIVYVEDSLSTNDGGSVLNFPFSPCVGANIVVSQAPLAQLVLRAPESPIAGAPFILSVSAENAYGNIVPYSDSISFSSTDASSLLPDAYQFNAIDSGVHTFTGVVLDTAGPQMITVSDPQTGVAGSVTLNVQPGPAPATPPPPTVNVLNPSGIVMYGIIAGSDGALWGLTWA